MKLVKIVWDDAHDYASGKWVDKKEAQGKAAIGVKVTTVGLLLKEGKKYYTIAHTVTQENDVRGVFNIPRSTVRSIKILK